MQLRCYLGVQVDIAGAHPSAQSYNIDITLNILANI
jgi:hypothetical protein